MGILLLNALFVFGDDGKDPLPEGYTIAKEKLKKDPKEAIDFIDKILISKEALESKRYQAKLHYTKFRAYHSISEVSKLKESALKAIELFEEIGDFKSALNTKYYLSINLYNAGDEQGGSTLLDEAYKLSFRLKDTVYQIRTLYQKGYFDCTKANYDNSLENTLAALNILERANCCAGQKIAILNILGIIYTKTDEPEKALEYLEQAKMLIEKTGIKSQETNVNNNIGIIYLNQKDYKTAEPYFHKAYEISLEAEDRPDNFAMGLGDFYVTSGQYAKAKPYLEKVIPNFNKRKDHSQEGLAKGLLGIAELGLGNSNRALNLFTEADQIISMSDHEVNKQEIFNKMSVACYQNGFYKEAFNYSNKLRNVEQGIFQNEKQEKLLSLQTELETKQKEQEIIHLKKQKEVSSKMFLMSSLVGILSVLMLLGLWYAYSLLRKNNGALTKAKERAELAAKSKAEFLATMSHEIRTPMNGVVGMANILSEEDPRPDQKENLDILKFSADNLLNLINDVLDLAKIESGNIELEQNGFDLKDYCKKAFAVFKNGNSKSNIDLKLDLNIDSISNQVISDQLRLNQVITNLINNAVKFTKQGSVTLRVTKVGLDKDSTRVKFEVIDTGIGISKEKQQTIFEKYQQAESDTSRLYGGTGLGLNISKEIIELFGSELKLESEIGQGSNFYFEIDFQLGEKLNLSKPVITAATGEGKLNGMKILLAEDNKVNQIVAKRILVGWGIDLTIAQNGQEAVEQATAHHFDLVLMDIQMPIMDGFEATDNIRQLPGTKGETPIFAMTASAFTSKEKSKGHKMNGHISKPFNPDELLTIISQYYRNEKPKEQVTSQQ